MADKFDIHQSGAKVIKKYNLGIDRDRFLAGLIFPYLEKGDKVLDIGCGLGRITKMIKDEGHIITPLDVRDLSIDDDISPLIYNGKKIPFADKSFDVSLIITVLHHTVSPEAILREARRVSKKIIIIEDIYKNSLQKYFTFLNDSVLNLEFFGHPHSNMNDLEWKKTFKKLNLKLVNAKYAKRQLVLHGIYFLST